MKVSIVGTNGLPSKYGGFETLVHFLVQNLAKELDITVFCSSLLYDKKPSRLNGCNLEYINLSANGWQRIFYDFISLYKSRHYDTIIILGSSGGILMPLLSKYSEKFILNFGGLDWKRSKWSYFARVFLKYSEKLSIYYSKYIIADNEGIKNYIWKSYKRHSSLIEYGSDQAVPVKPNPELKRKYPFLGDDYAFSVARIQPDNNIDIILDAFSKNKEIPLVFMGNWSNSVYGLSLKQKYKNKENIILVEAIYDQNILNVFRSNCYVYIHGHSAGGTNPSLVEAMNLSLPIIAYDCNFNRYTTENNHGWFCKCCQI